MLSAWQMSWIVLSDALIWPFSILESILADKSDCFDSCCNVTPAFFLAIRTCLPIEASSCLSLPKEGRFLSMMETPFSLGGGFFVVATTK